MEQTPWDAFGHNVLGMVHEFQGMFSLAQRNYQSALSVLGTPASAPAGAALPPSSSGVTIVTNKDHVLSRDMKWAQVLNNLIRVQTMQGVLPVESLSGLSLDSLIYVSLAQCEQGKMTEAVATMVCYLLHLYFFLSVSLSIWPSFSFCCSLSVFLSF